MRSPGGRVAGLRVGFDQALLAQDGEHGGDGADGRALGRGGRGVGEGRVQQAVGVVGGGAQQLAAGHVLEDRGDPALHEHGAGVDGAAMGEAGQGGAVGAQQERGLDQVALGLQDGECGELAVEAGALGHDAVDGAAELGVELGGVDQRQRRIAAAGGGAPGMGGVDGALAALDRDVRHQPAPMRSVRGRAARRSPAHRIRSMPRGKRAWFAAHSARNVPGRPSAWKRAGAARPGPSSV